MSKNIIDKEQGLKFPIEKIEQYLTTERYKIFSDATLQNIESAKINLIQNKLRICVSNMYYSLHNGIPVMIEYYKLMNDSNSLLENINEKLDDEATIRKYIQYQEKQDEI